MIFVDTSAWFAAFVANDPNHRAASAWFAANTEVLVTTDFVLDELLTLLRIRSENARALELGQALLEGAIAALEWVLPEDVRAAWQVFSGYRDKRWSFTDCVSRVVMVRLHVHTAFAFDQHFQQFGTVNVVP